MVHPPVFTSISGVSAKYHCLYLPRYGKFPFLLKTSIATGTEHVVSNYWKQMSWKETLDRLSAQVDPSTFASLLRWCGTAKALPGGRCIHDHIIKCGLDRNLFLGSLLVQMYGKCGTLEDALILFRNMHRQKVFLWNCMIRAYVQHGQVEEGLQLFETMWQEGILPDKFTFICVLSLCANQETLTAGKRAHALIQNSGLEQDIFLATALFGMYGKYGSLQSAWSMFEKMPHRDSFSWTAMLALYAQHGQAEQALQLFNRMLQGSVVPSEVTFVCIFDVCASSAMLAEGKLVHTCMLEYIGELDMVLGNTLVNMYGKCGRLEDARQVFDNMLQRDAVSWNTIITAYAQHGQAIEALQFFDQFQREGVMPSKVTFICILDACASSAALTEGKHMHHYIMDVGFDSDPVVETTLLNMYGKCGSIEDAQRMFDRMRVRNVVSWTAMIAVCAQHGKGKDSLYLFDQMQQEGIEANKVTLVCMLDACASETALFKGKCVHACSLDCGFQSDVVVDNALINMYGKCGSMEGACRIFYRMQQRDVVSWSAIIAVYGQHGHGKQAVQLFERMQQELVDANKVTFLCILDACAGSAMLAEGKQIHACIIKNGFEHDFDLGTALVNLYGKCGSLEDAQRMFDKMPEQNVVSWTALIAACAVCGRCNEALEIFKEMQLQGVMPNNVTFVSILDAYVGKKALAESKWMHACIMQSSFESDVIVGNALVSMYGKYGSIEDAQKMFDKMPERDVVSWTAMIAVYAQHCKGKKALQLFGQMQHEGLEPNKVTFICVLDACASCAALVSGEQILGRILERKFESDVVVGTALVNMYGKCGNVDSARSIFDKVPEKNVVLWTAMVMVYAQHGRGKEALQLFQQMQQDGFQPDDVTLVSLLAACSHSGLVDEGWHFFASMTQGGFISPAVDHYVCMIDLLGRAGRLDEAERLIRSMPFKPTVATHMAFLGACRYQGDATRGEHAAANVFEADPENPAPYIMLSNIYAAAGREDDAAELISRATDKSLWKQSGCCTIEVNGMVHEFLAEEDGWHPQQDMIHSMLHSLMEEMKEVGYASGFLKEHTLCSHSERLAIAFGLISTPSGTLLLITKDAGVCPDCHSVAKFISNHTQRTIVIRDSRRFHKMADGICSCDDYW